MSYLTELDGDLTINPPLNWAEVRENPYHLNENDDKCILLVVDREEILTNEGLLHKWSCHTVSPSSSSFNDHRHLLTQLRELITLIGDQHTVSGEIHVTGSRWGDIAKVRVEDGEVTWLVPTITWPDGTEQKSDWEL